MLIAQLYDPLGDNKVHLTLADLYVKASALSFMSTAHNDKGPTCTSTVHRLQSALGDVTEGTKASPW